MVTDWTQFWRRVTEIAVNAVEERLATFRVDLGRGQGVYAHTHTDYAPSGAQYLVGASASAPVGAVVVPHLGQSPDALPASPTAYDDEFDAATLDPKWGWVNQGSATATLSHSYLHLAVPGAADTQVRAVVQAVTGNWTLTARVALVGRLAANCGAGLCLRDNGTGKLVLLQLNHGGILVTYMNSATSEDSTPATGPASYGYGWQYLQVQATASDLVFRYSPTGTTWVTLATLSRTAWLASITHAGLFANSNASTYPQTLVADFIRKSS